MKNSELLPPDTFAIDEEIDDLFKHGDVKQVSRFSGIKYPRLAAMLRTDDPLENCGSESISLMYGIAVNDRDKGKSYFQIHERHAEAWGLVDDSPQAILQTAIRKIQQIKPEEIKQLTPDEETVVLSLIAQLERAARKITDAVCGKGGVDIGGLKSLAGGAR